MLLVLFYNTLSFSGRLGNSSGDVLSTMLGSDNSIQSKFQCSYLSFQKEHHYIHIYTIVSNGWNLL